MLVIFDLNRTLICKYPSLKVRPHFKELYQFLKQNAIKIGFWSFCQKHNYEKVLTFLQNEGYQFDLTRYDSIDSTKAFGKERKKDLNIIALELNIKLDEIILIEDDETKCVEKQNRLIVKPFDGDYADVEFKSIKLHFERLLNK
ncbi:hypothetical protein CDIK_0925 [Cucumispora dikerogammari]|nr:hypothetical protein CDIK_0925 [Cucumispora dikerogammari]